MGEQMERYLTTSVWCRVARALLVSSVLAVPPAVTAEEPEEDYVGSEICAECHEDKFEQILPSKHGQTADLRTPFGQHGCETCHAAGSTHAGSEGEERGGLIVFGADTGVAVARQNGSCLNCHQDTRRLHWQGSAHDASALSCANCHKVHQPDGVLRKAEEMDVCLGCHWQVRADLYKASHHPIREGGIVCTDCHNPHGSDGPKSLKALTLNQACYACHADKRGPFLWEHEPVTDLCTNCHVPHGSNNPALLMRRAPLLCQQCHQTLSGGGATAGNALGHVRLFLDAAGQAQFVAGYSCMNCHSQVHGSNHPAGVALQR